MLMAEDALQRACDPIGGEGNDPRENLKEKKPVMRQSGFILNYLRLVEPNVFSSPINYLSTNSSLFLLLVLM
jgi:hypothetical protein